MGGALSLNGLGCHCASFYWLFGYVCDVLRPGQCFSKGNTQEGDVLVMATPKRAMF